MKKQELISENKELKQKLLIKDKIIDIIIKENKELKERLKCQNQTQN